MAMAMAMMTTGDEVEVRRKNAWYEATVVRTMPRLRRYTVSYSVPLLFPLPCREDVDWTQVRPRPKRDSKRGDWLEVGDAVEAYYLDGWWSGVILVKGGSGAAAYSVGLSESGEVVWFPKEELRPHFHWIHGEWRLLNPKENNSNTEVTTFNKGAMVEISSDEEGFCGAWFAATVIKSFGIGNKFKFLVEYRDICTEEDGKERLREMVDSLHIRPLPPTTTTLQKENFKLLEEVDALHQDGWWVGVICNIITDTNYVVFFRHTNETIEFQRHQLRPHYDFIGGNWVRASQALGL